MKLHGEDVLQVGGRVGADEQHVLATVGKAGGHCTGGGGLADTPLAGEEQVLRQVELAQCKWFHQQHPPSQQHSCLPRRSCGRDSQSVNSSLVG